MVQRDRSVTEDIDGFAVDASAEDAYWQANYSLRPYVTPGTPYGDYQDAYRYGWESRSRYDSTWDEASADLERGWDQVKTTSRLTWAEAKQAVRDAWHRVERALPGDADNDGR